MTRSNGLGAPAYTAVAEFAPALGDGVAEALLWRLESAGVAAYLDARDGGDELYVDTRRVDQAYQLLDASGSAGVGAHSDTGAAGAADPTPSAPQVAVDADVWAALVEAYNMPTAPSIGRWPSIEDLDENADGRGDGDGTGVGGLRFDEPVRSRPRAQPDDEDPRSAPAAEHRSPAEPVDHFEPPEPPPLPRVPVGVLAGWLCATVVPVVLVVLGLLGIALPTALLLLAAGLFVYGIGVLFSQLRSVPVDSDGERLDGDDGAEV